MDATRPAPTPRPAPRPALALTAAVVALLAAGCTGSSDGDGSGPEPAYGLVFLDRDECASRGRADVREVPCGGERAAARVLARNDVPRGLGPPCPDETDYVLRISEHGGGTAASGPGYACMRLLKGPHPGDPGGGGGPVTVVGDCLYAAEGGTADDGGESSPSGEPSGEPSEEASDPVQEVKETPCDGSGAWKPEFEVTATVRERDDCPPRTSLYVDLDAAEPVGCARRL